LRLALTGLISRLPPLCAVDIARRLLRVRPAVRGVDGPPLAEVESGPPPGVGEGRASRGTCGLPVLPGDGEAAAAVGGFDERWDAPPSGTDSCEASPSKVPLSERNGICASNDDKSDTLSTCAHRVSRCVILRLITSDWRSTRNEVR
jgi:hypothetical protein